MASVFEEIQDVFRLVFKDDDIVLSEFTTANDIEGWDSLAHINLMIAIEKRFKIRLATAEISGTRAEGSNVGTLVKIVQARMAKQ